MSSSPLTLGKHNDPSAGQLVSMRETTFNNLLAKGTTRKSSNSEYNSASNAKLGLGSVQAIENELEPSEAVRSRLAKVRKMISDYSENNSHIISKKQTAGSHKKLQLSIN